MHPGDGTLGVGFRGILASDLGGDGGRLSSAGTLRDEKHSSNQCSINSSLYAPAPASMSGARLYLGRFTGSSASVSSSQRRRLAVSELADEFHVEMISATELLWGRPASASAADKVESSVVGRLCFCPASLRGDRG